MKIRLGARFLLLASFSANAIIIRSHVAVQQYRMSASDSDPRPSEDPIGPMAENLIGASTGGTEAIADYIAPENPAAASAHVQRVVAHAEPLAEHPESGARVPELGRSRYRQWVKPPCRVFYRYDGQCVFIAHVMRTERLQR